jgi:hypothetical protein
MLVLLTTYFIGAFLKSCVGSDRLTLATSISHFMICVLVCGGARDGKAVSEF